MGYVPASSVYRAQNTCAYFLTSLDDLPSISDAMPSQSELLTPGQPRYSNKRRAFSPSMTFDSSDELLEVTLGPAAETLFLERLFLLLLLLGQGLRVIDLFLFRAALVLEHLRRLGVVHGLTQRHLDILGFLCIGDALARPQGYARVTHLPSCRLALLQFDEPRREELMVLYRKLLGRPRHLGALVRLRRSSAHRVLVILVDRVVALPLALGRLDPIQANGFALYAIHG